MQKAGDFSLIDYITSLNCHPLDIS